MHPLGYATLPLSNFRTLSLPPKRNPSTHLQSCPTLPSLAPGNYQSAFCLCGFCLFWRFLLYSHTILKLFRCLLTHPPTKAGTVILGGYLGYLTFVMAARWPSKGLPLPPSLGAKNQPFLFAFLLESSELNLRPNFYNHVACCHIHFSDQTLPLSSLEYTTLIFLLFSSFVFLLIFQEFLYLCLILFWNKI